MNKTMLFTLILIALVCFHITSAESFPTGDVSGDGMITAHDASLALQDIVGLTELSLAQQHAADVTGDSHVTALDAALILQYVVGIIKRFPVDTMVAEAGLDQSVFVNEEVTFDGSGSSDNIGITSYNWDFDANNGIQEDATGVTVTHTYTAVGTYTVTLTVSDDAGNADSDTLTVTVSEGPIDVVSYPFQGIKRIHRTATLPRPLNLNILEVDLTDPSLSLFVTQPNPNRTGPNDEVLARKTSTFVAEFNLQVGINGDFASTARVPEYAPRGVEGLAVSNGVQYSDDAGRPALTFNQLNEPYIGRAPFPSGVYNAVGGNKMLVENGQPVDPATWDPIGGALAQNPRTSAGISADGTKLIIIVIDGRQTGFSEGVTLPEMSEYLIEFGAYTGVNHDGGGSSTLVLEGPTIINYPSDAKGERIVPNHLGIYAAPMAAPLAQAQSDLEESVPDSTVLLANYPNPFNPETWIPFTLSDDAHVVIRIYNLSGQLIRTLDLGNRSSGVYVSRDKAARWDGRNIAGEKISNGIYFYAMEAGAFRAVRKMVIIK